MSVSKLENLSNDGLVDLGAQLELDLVDTKKHLQDIVADLDARERPLVKPGVKLALNAVLGIAGISLAPLTLGWSLIGTLIGGAITISDAFDFGGDVSRIRARRREIVRLGDEVTEIVVQLEDINTILTRRLGSS